MNSRAPKPPLTFEASLKSYVSSILAIGCAGGIAVLSLLPAEKALSSGWNDKVEHTAAYLVLAVLTNTAWPRNAILRTWIGCACYGGMIELAQTFSPGRQADVLDLLANGAGAAAGLALTLMWSKRQIGLPK